VFGDKELSPDVRTSVKDGIGLREGDMWKEIKGAKMKQRPLEFECEESAVGNWEKGGKKVLRRKKGSVCFLYS
jgi:hypothetical protein